MSSNPNSGQLLLNVVLKPYMTETFLMNAFQKMGEKPISVKFTKKRKNNEVSSCCTVNFQSEDDAKKALSELNGKVIPNTVPPIKFLLSLPGMQVEVPEYSLWITDLSTEIDDNTLHKTFSTRYQSLILAKVIVDITGFSRGIGHLKFSNEDDQKNCLNHMNGFKGLGSRPLKLSHLLPPGLWHRGSNNNHGSSQDQTNKFEKGYWQNYTAWQNGFKDALHNSFATQMITLNIIDTAGQKEDELDLIEHNTKLDIDNWNRELIQRDYNLWDALECSKWLPLNMSE